MSTANRTAQDRADFTAFVQDEEVEADLGKTLKKRGVKPQDVGDITQYALMRLWERWDTTPKDDRLRLARHAARHRWIDILRSKYHHNPVIDPMDTWLTETVDPASDPATLATQRQLVRALVNSLPATQRSVFVYTLDGVPPREIAKELKLTESTVRSHLRHGRNRLRTLLVADNSA
ncbi:RNA polymerase sigma factor [Streptomyces canus]|uniref:RNA polymerase sigma factor n=1 Tax=Streptomyces canus TaxID=58343 RepID=UPI0036AB9544